MFTLARDTSFQFKEFRKFALHRSIDQSITQCETIANEACEIQFFVGLIGATNEVTFLIICVTDEMNSNSSDLHAFESWRKN